MVADPAVGVGTALLANLIAGELAASLQLREREGEQENILSKLKK